MLGGGEGHFPNQKIHLKQTHIYNSQSASNIIPGSLQVWQGTYAQHLGGRLAGFRACSGVLFWFCPALQTLDWHSPTTQANNAL